MKFSDCKATERAPGALPSSNFSPETKRSPEFRVLSRHFTILEKLHSREYPVSEEEEKEEGGRGR